MNPVLILTHNCLELTKKCIKSVQKQDVDTQIYVFDNGSTDDTKEWLECKFEHVSPKQIEDWWSCSGNEGVTYGWNTGLNLFFRSAKKPHVLVVNNDTILPPWFYSELLSYNEPFVTGVAVENMEQIAHRPERMPLDPHPDFSAFLIKRSVWEKVGPFDERMKLYASDCDYHVRAHRAGIKMYKANCPFYHERSSTLKKATPEERREIEQQSHRDREVFKSLYGCLPGEPAYYELFN